MTEEVKKRKMEAEEARTIDKKCKMSEEEESKTLEYEEKVIIMTRQKIELKGIMEKKIMIVIRQEEKR